MFSAHLVFGDMNRHANLPFLERSEQLEKFWRICEEAKPRINSHSFYGTDNDSFKAGFSNLEGLCAGEEVLKFVIDLSKRLTKAGIDISFGVNLVAVRRDIEWATYKGIFEHPGMIHMPDEIFEREGGVIRRERLSGDCLIATARILAIAKKLKKKICFSILNGGHLRGGEIDIPRHEICEQSDGVEKLSVEHAKWMREKKIKVFSLEEKKPKRQLEIGE